MTNNPRPSYQWRFFRAGGFDQVKLETGADLMALDQLDLKLWLALACPVSGLEFDKTTLAMMDTDKDGRVRAPELLEAVKWAGSLLKNPDDLMKGASELPLKAINESLPAGKAIATFARQILGKNESDQITIAEGISAAETFAAKPINGDGIITADSASDEDTKAAIADIISCLGSDLDASGKPGVSQARVDQFFADATAYSDWWKKAEGNAVILPLGLDTNTASGAMKAVRSKVDDYFARCRLAAYDPRSLAALNRDEKEYLILAAKDLSATIRAKLNASKDYVIAARTVVGPVLDCAIEATGDGSIPKAPPEPMHIAALAQRYGVQASMRRVVDALKA